MRFLIFVKQLISQSVNYVNFVGSRFFADQCVYRAAALTFTSLLAIVPLMSVSLTIFSAFPVFDQLATPIQDFIFENFIPARSKVVQEYLQQFVAQVSRLSVTGLSFLIVSAVMVLFTIEQAMNQIWRVPVRRTGLSAVLRYWAVLSLAPLLIGLSIAATSYLFSWSLLSDTAMQVGLSKALLLQWLPFLLSMATFLLLYIAMPNCKVVFWHALAGALFAAILFECSKMAFVFYIQQFRTYELIYGAFATVPLFFLWIYWVWIIVLLGAEVSYAFAVSYERRQGKSLSGFVHAFHWLGYLWQAQQQGRGLSMQELIMQDEHGYDISPDRLLQHMILVKLVKMTANGRFILCRDLSSLTLIELHQLLPWPLPNVRQLQDSLKAWDQTLLNIISHVEPVMREQLSMPLASVYEQM